MNRKIWTFIDFFWNKTGFVLGLRKFSNLSVLQKGLLLQDWVLRLGKFLLDPKINFLSLDKLIYKLVFFSKRNFPSPAIGDLFVVHSNLRIFAALKQNQFIPKKSSRKFKMFSVLFICHVSVGLKTIFDRSKFLGWTKTFGMLVD